MTTTNDVKRRDDVSHSLNDIKAWFEIYSIQIDKQVNEIT